MPRESWATVRLVRVDDERPLCDESFDTEFTDIFPIQDRISEQVAEALRIELSDPERDQIAAIYRAEPLAYEAYVRGRYFWNKRTGSDLERAIEYFQEAIEHDADYPAAYAGLADSYVLLPLFAGLPPSEAFPPAIAAAQRALQLDPDLAEAHTSLAYSRFIYEWDWRKAEAEFKEAIELNPNYAIAQHWFAYELIALGRHEEAIRFARRAQVLPPLSLIINADLGFVYYFSGRFDPAVKQVEKTLELDSAFAYAHFGLGLAEYARRRSEVAIEAAKQAVELAAGSTAMMAALGYILADSGHLPEATVVLEEMRAMAKAQYVQSSHFALISAGLGDAKRALDRLEVAYEEHSRFLVFLNVWPVFAGLRDEPRFRELVARVGLPSDQSVAMK